jgi:endonuclease YncB( thermonuclease family)
MIHTGWARRQAAAGFIEVEQEARAAARGLWQYKLPPPPWPEPGK